MKTFAYIDGFNLYRGMMDPSNNMPGATTRPVLRPYLWLDLHAFVESYFVGNCSLDRIHYFTAPVRDSVGGLKRQETFWKALESHAHLKIHKGFNLKKYDNQGNFLTYEEKQTDVRFGLQVLEDALIVQEIERMVFVCADADQVPTIEKVKIHRPDIQLRLIFPPCRQSGALENLIPKPIKTRYEALRDNQFPDPVEYERDGVQISVSKPTEWS
ncbi:MAG: NYN domain-containing protein [Anaerolineales bacterium]